MRICRSPDAADEAAGVSKPMRNATLRAANAG